MTEYRDYIRTVIDKSIDFSNQYLSGLHLPDVLVPEYMIDGDKSSPYKDIVFWKPVRANIPKEHFVELKIKLVFRYLKPTRISSHISILLN